MLKMRTCSTASHMRSFSANSALNEARQGGYTGPASVIGHGVDLDIYQPKDKATARHMLDLPHHAFIIGNVNTNAARKRFDLTLYSLQDLPRDHDAPDAYLYCHCAEAGEGWDLPQLAQYLGIADRVLFPPAALLGPGGVSEAMMPYVYSALDMQISTTQGEGFGLTTLEGLALRRSADHSRLCGPGRMGTRRVYAGACALPDGEHRQHEPGVLECRLPRDGRGDGEALPQPGRRRIAAQHGLMFVQQPQFRWETLAAQFQSVLEGVAEPCQRSTA